MEWLTNLVFHQLGFYSMVADSSLTHDNMWDSPMACPDMHLTIERDIKPLLLPPVASCKP